MEPLTLDRNELYELTGYRKKSKQLEVLRREGIRFLIGADGYPRVVRAQLTRTAAAERATTPDVEALRLITRRGRR